MKSAVDTESSRYRATRVAADPLLHPLEVLQLDGQLRPAGGCDAGEHDPTVPHGSLGVDALTEPSFGIAQRAPSARTAPTAG